MASGDNGKKNNGGKLFLILLALLVVIGVILFFIFRDKDKGGGNGSGQGGVEVVSGQLPGDSTESTEKESGSNTEQTTDTAAETGTETVTETKTEKQTESVTEPKTEKQTEAATEPKTEKQTEAATEPKTEKQTEKTSEANQGSQGKAYKFRSKKLLEQHYEKHGIEMGFPDTASYVAAANDVILDPSSLYKVEKEDGDDVYYRERDNAFVVVSRDGYIRTFFYPSGGKKYFDRQ